MIKKLTKSLLLVAALLCTTIAAHADPVDLPLEESFFHDGSPALGEGWVSVQLANTYKWTAARSSDHSPSPTAQDGDGGLVYYCAWSGSNGKSRLYSPEISTASSTAPTLSFFFHHYSNSSTYNDYIIVEIAKNGTEDWQQIDQIKAYRAAAGWQEYTYLLKDYIEGSTTYRIAFTAVGGGGYDFAVDNVIVKNDVTAYFKPTNMTVSQSAKGITVDWENPDGYDNLTYDIVRYVNGNISQEFNGETTKPFVDDYTPNGIETVYYTVTLHAGDLTSGTVASEPIKIGSLQLPVTESFAGAKIGEQWTNADVTNNSYKWAATSSISGATPQDKDGGFVYFDSYSSSSRGQTARLVSEPISAASSVNPYLSFYFYHNTSGSDKLYVEVKKDNGEWEVLSNGTITVNTSGKSGWTEYVFPLAEAIKDAYTYQIAFKGESAAGQRLCIDNIRIYNDIKVTDLTVVPNATGFTVSWTAPNVEGDITYDVIRYINGVESQKFENETSPFNDTYAPEGLEKISYKVVTNLGEASDNVTSDELIIGSVDLPVAESFAGNKLGEYWSIENSGSTLKWSTIASSNGPTLSPQDNDGGLLYANCNLQGTAGETSRLISPSINATSSVYPTVNFWFYHTTNTDGTDDDDTLVVEISKDNGAWTEVPNAIVHRLNGTIGWKEYNFPIIDAIGDCQTYRVALKAVSAYGYGMYIDNVRIENDFRVSDITVNPVANGYEVSWTTPAYEGELTYDLVRLINGEESKTYTDVTSPFVDEYAPETVEILSYKVVSKAGEVTSDATSGSLKIGNVVLPVTETFAEATLGTGWEITTTKEGYQWVPMTSSSAPSVSPKNFDRGLLWYNSASAGNGSTTSLVSPPILTASAEFPVVSFWFYHWQNGSWDTYKDKAVVEVSKDGGEFVEVAGPEIIRNANSSGWTLYTFPILTEIEGSTTFQVAIKGISANGYNMVIDDVTIENNVLEYFKVTDVTLTAGTEENQYIVDWVNPVGYDETGMTYDITRYVDGEMSAEFKGETTKPFVDTYIPSGIEKLSYTVTVTKDGLTTEPASSEIITIGSVNLPFADSFAGNKLNPLWDIEFERSTYKWETASSASNPYASPQDSDGGLISFNTYSATSGATSTLITPPLNTVSSGNAVVSFWLYGPGTSNATLNVLVSKDGEEWEQIEGAEIVLKNAASGWHEYKYDLASNIEGSKTYRVAFKGTSDYGSYRIIMDNIKIYNDIAVKDVTLTPVEGGYNLSWTAPEIEPVTFDIVRYINGEVSETFENVEENPFFDEYIPEKIELLYYTVTVKSGEMVSEAVKSKEIKIGSVNLPLAESFADAKMPEQWDVVLVKSGFSGDITWNTTKNESPANVPQDEDGGFVYANCVTYPYRTSEVQLITPPISTASSTNPELSFWMYHYTDGDDKLTVQISVDGGDWTDIEGSEVTVKGSPTGWTEYKYSLTALIKDSQTYQVAFKAESAGGRNICLDNILIENKAEYDLAVSNISGPTAILAGNKGEYSFTVFNKGGHDVAADEYTVTLNAIGVEVEPIETEAIAAGESVEYTFEVDYTAHHVAEEAYVFSVEVAYAQDELEENNVSEELETIVSSSDKNVVEEVGATAGDNTVTITWKPVIDMNGYEPVDIAESFETLGVGTTGSFNGFTGVRTCETATSGSWFGVNATPFMVTDQIKSSFSTGPTPTDGSMYLVAVNNKQLDDWLISPELNCFDLATKALSFDAYLYITTGKVSVLYSTTDNTPESFVNTVKEYNINSYSNPGAGAWYSYQLTEIPAEAKYIAIRFTATDSYSVGVLVDNVLIVDEFEPVLGYHVYEEGVGRVNTEMISASTTEPAVKAVAEGGKLSYTINDVANGIHHYTVTAVYAEGESAKSEAVQVEVGTSTGVEGIETDGGDGDDNAVYYNLQGVRVVNPTTGVYIRVEGNTATKVYVK